MTSLAVPSADVLGAVGLTFDTLYPVRPVDHRVLPERRPVPAADVLRAVEQEMLIAATGAAYLGNGGTLSGEDRARLLLASERIAQAIRESRHV